MQFIHQHINKLSELAGKKKSKNLIGSIWSDLVREGEKCNI